MISLANITSVEVLMYSLNNSSNFSSSIGLSFDNNLYNYQDALLVEATSTFGRK